jgi:hypothetical protein
MPFGIPQNGSSKDNMLYNLIQQKLAKDVEETRIPEVEKQDENDGTSHQRTSTGS